LKEYAAAVASYDRALALSEDAEVHNSRGTALAELKRFHEALASYDRAIALRPGMAAAHSNRGAVLERLRQFESALEHCDRAVALQTDFAEAHFNRGNVLKELGRHEEALASYDRAVALKAGWADPYCNRGRLLEELHRWEAAIASYDNAITLKPDYALARLNRALALLSLGDLERGWREYEWRWQLGEGPFVAQRRGFVQPRWTGGEGLEGKTILLYAEQGLGDTLQFCRYVPLLARRRARVILQAMRRHTRTAASWSCCFRISSAAGKTTNGAGAIRTPPPWR
jgi:tetratricopeptide (TPR) repeat protein